MSKCVFCMEFEAELCPRCITNGKDETARLRAEVERLKILDTAYEDLKTRMWKSVEELERERDEAQAQVQKLNEGAVDTSRLRQAEAVVKTLKEILKGEGEFSLDPLTHACNAINNMKKLARKALAAWEEEGRIK